MDGLHLFKMELVLNTCIFISRNETEGIKVCALITLPLSGLKTTTTALFLKRCTVWFLYVEGELTNARKIESSISSSIGASRS